MSGQSVGSLTLLGVDVDWNTLVIGAASAGVTGADCACGLGSLLARAACAWLGGGVIVLPGVTIGEGAVIGAGSVVTRPVAAGVVAAGNPCRAIATP